jgi:hypothetical protein
MTEEEWKPKKHRLNAKQKQEKLEVDLRAKVKYSRAHKAATKLYAAELEKGEKGMSSRKVEAAIKKSTMELVRAMQQFTTMWLPKAR